MIWAIRAAALAATLAAATAASAAPAQPAPPPLGAGAERISIEDFAQLPFLSGPRLSPDGRKIAAHVIDGEQEKIAVWTLGEDGERELRTIEVADIDGYAWAGEDRLLIGRTMYIFVVGRHSFVSAPARRVFRYDLDSGDVLRLGPAAGFVDEVVYTDPVGRYVLLSTQEDWDKTPSVHRVDLATGASVEVQPRQRGVWDWFADGRGNVRVGVDYGERRTRIYYRPAGGGALHRVETRRNLRDDSVIDAIRFVTDSDRGVIVTNSETGRFALYEYDIATDSLGKVLFEHAEVDVGDLVLGADGAVAGVAYEDDRPRVHWLDPGLAALQARIDATFPGMTNRIVDRSRNGNRVLIWSSSASDPGTYYVFDQAARRMEAFASPYDLLHGRDFAEVRPVRYRGRDGLEIPAYLTLPRGRPARGLPLIVMPHGGPFLRDGWAFDPDVQFLASRGYAVLQPNFRGSTGYGRDFVERGHGQLGTGMIDDIDDGVEWLVREGVADRGRVCIMGGSYGGYAALWASIRSPERYRCAISIAAPTDLRRMLRHDRREYLPRRYFRSWRRQIEGEEEADLDAVSPLRHAGRLRVPLLLAHGEKDQRVPVDHARRLVRELERNGADHEAVIYPEAGHSFTRAEDSADFLRRVEAFLARHNPAG